MAIAVAVEAVVIALLGLLVCGLLRSHAEVLRKLRELEEGAPEAPAPAGAPATARPSRPAFDVVGTTLDDEMVKVGIVGARHPTLLAFLSSGCLMCGNFWSAFAREGAKLVVPGGARLVVVAKGPAEESVSRLDELAPEDLPVVLSTEAWLQYDVPVAPFFVYVDGPTGEIRASGAAESWDQVMALWSRALSGLPGQAGRAREARVDRELLEAGIHPGHASVRGTAPAPRKDG